MRSKIDLAFKKCREEKRPALITYTVAGDNTKNNSLKILNKISKHVDILELGFPHNTPIADGGQIQSSSNRALKNGIKLKDVFQIVKKFKKQFEGRWVAFGTYDINYPNGATHWVGISGKDDHEHVMLYDELQKQSEFIKLIGERGKVEDVRDYMVTSLKTY